MAISSYLKKIKLLLSKIFSRFDNDKFLLFLNRSYGIFLLLLITIIGSNSIIPFFKTLGSLVNPEQQLEEHNDLIKTVAIHLRKIADDLEILSKKKN